MRMSKDVPSDKAGARARRHGRIVPVEWPTVALIGFCHVLWLVAGLWIWPVMPVAGLLVLGVVLALQSSLMHEVAHGHPTRNAAVNEALVFLPLGLVYPFRRFRSLHLRHHHDERLTDPFDDPESYYQALWKYEQRPAFLKLVLRLNNTILGRVVLGPLLGSVGFVLNEARLARVQPGIARAWLVHAAGLALVVPLVVLVFQIPLWLYVLVPVWIGQSLISVRTYAEHQWSERPDGRTVIVERSPLALLFLNNNLHLVHHKMPRTPWYLLPRLFREQREDWLKLNGGYVFPGYLAMLRHFALAAKEPVVHPVLRRTTETGRALRPCMRTRHGQGAVAVPAEPARD